MQDKTVIQQSIDLFLSLYDFFKNNKDISRHLIVEGSEPDLLDAIVRIEIEDNGLTVESESEVAGQKKSYEFKFGKDKAEITYVIEKDSEVKSYYLWADGPNVMLTLSHSGVSKFVSKEEQEILFTHLANVVKLTIVPLKGAIETLEPADSEERDQENSSDLERIDRVPNSGEALSSEEAQENISDFDTQKREIQKQFMESLTSLQAELNATQNDSSRIEGKKLFDTLFNKQKLFFEALTINSIGSELDNAIIDLRKLCKENLEIADKIMGHGWLYRIVEVLIKAVVGLFVGIGMILGSVIGQGLVKSAHRQKFVTTFFTANQTEESQILAKFKQELLGDEQENLGLLSSQNFINK